MPESDGFEAGWRGYYESTFNPARANLRAMRAEMPKKYWHNMPETAAIPGLIRAAAPALAAMIERRAAMPTKRSPHRAVAAMADQDAGLAGRAQRHDRRSSRWCRARTQAVLGEGPADAAIAFVGEQPGDQEDLAGPPLRRPGGPASRPRPGGGRHRRARAYLTNAVKHFKFEQRGKRRIHQKPTAGEVSHYRWWLDAGAGVRRARSSWWRSAPPRCWR